MGVSGYLPAGPTPGLDAREDKYSRLEPGDGDDGPGTLGAHATFMELARRRSE